MNIIALCNQLSSSKSPILKDIIYTVGSGLYPIYIDGFAFFFLDCDTTYQLTVTVSPSANFIKQDVSMVNIDTSNPLMSGSYKVVVTATVNSMQKQQA